MDNNDYIHHIISIIILLFFGLEYTILANALHYALNVRTKGTKLMLLGSMSMVLLGYINTLLASMSILLYECIMRDMHIKLGYLIERLDGNNSYFRIIKNMKKTLQDIYHDYLTRVTVTSHKYALFNYYHKLNGYIGYFVNKISNIIGNMPFINKIFRRYPNDRIINDMFEDISDRPEDTGNASKSVPSSDTDSIPTNNVQYSLPDIEDIMKKPINMEDLFKTDHTFDDKLPTKEDMDNLRNMLDMMDNMTNMINLANGKMAKNKN